MSLAPYSRAITDRYNAALDAALVANDLANSLRGPSPADTTAATDLVLEAADEVVAAATAEMEQYAPGNHYWLKAAAMRDLYRDQAARRRAMRAHHISY